MRAEEVRVLEFKRYVHDDEEIYRFNTLSPDETETEPPWKPPKIARERPPHRQTWKARLEWTSPNVRELVEFVKEKILELVPSAIHGPRQRQRHYFFYIQDPQVHRNIFAVILIQKQMLRVRFRLPDDFEDPKGITKLYKGWFFSKGQERAVDIKSKQDIKLLDNYIILAKNYTNNIT